MLDLILVGYGLIALFVTASLLLEADRMRGHREPGHHTAVIAMIGGLLWPVLLLGVIEFGSMAVFSAALRRR